MDKSHTSIIDLSEIFTARASARSLLPPQDSQCLSRMNCIKASRFDSDSVSRNVRSRLGMTPSNLPLYSHLLPEWRDSYLYWMLCSVPCKITCSCFWLMLEIGVERLNPNAFPTSRSIEDLKVAKCPVHGKMAPSSMLFDLSGMIR